MMTSGTYYRPRRGIVAGATQRLSAARGPFEVRLRASAGVAPYFYCQKYHATQRITAELPDGSVEVAFRVSNVADVASWMALWNLELILSDTPELAGNLGGMEESVGMGMGIEE